MKKHKRRKWHNALQPVITPSRTLEFFLKELNPTQKLTDSNGNAYMAQEILKHSLPDVLAASVERVTIGTDQLLFWVQPDGARSEKPLYSYQ